MFSMTLTVALASTDSILISLEGVDDDVLDLDLFAGVVLPALLRAAPLPALLPDLLPGALMGFLALTTISGEMSVQMGTAAPPSP